MCILLCKGHRPTLQTDKDIFDDQEYMNETFATKDPTRTANYFTQRNRNVTSIYTPRLLCFVCSLSRQKPTQFNAFNGTLTVYSNGRFTTTLLFVQGSLHLIQPVKLTELAAACTGTVTVRRILFFNNKYRKMDSF
jgi:hypothetical protein